MGKTWYFIKTSESKLKQDSITVTNTKNKNKHKNNRVASRRALSL
jgi:hypothetical protein